MRRRTLRALAWVLGVVSVSIFLLAGGFRLDQYLLRRRAEHLLSDIRSLELRKSSYADARRVMDRWWDEAQKKGPCRRDWCDLEITLTDFARSQAEFVWQTPARSRIFGWLGARPAIVSANLRVRNDMVLGKTVEEFVGGPCHDFNDQVFCLTVIGHVQTGDRRYIDPRHPEYSFYKPSACTFCVDAHVIFSPYASPVDVQQLTDVNFDCITRWTPCETEEDILPTAWAQLQSDQALPTYTGGTCSEIIRALSRELGSVPLATVTFVGNMGEGPQITIRWDEQRGITQYDHRQNTLAQPDNTSIRTGDHLLVFEDHRYTSSDPCAVTPATGENLRIARRSVRGPVRSHSTFEPAIRKNLATTSQRSIALPCCCNKKMSY